MDNALYSSKDRCQEQGTRQTQTENELPHKASLIFIEMSVSELKWRRAEGVETGPHPGEPKKSSWMARAGTK
jgi:hypothetical protein